MVQNALSSSFSLFGHILCPGKNHEPKIIYYRTHPSEKNARRMGKIMFSQACVCLQGEVPQSRVSSDEYPRSGSRPFLGVPLSLVPCPFWGTPASGPWSIWWVPQDRGTSLGRVGVSQSQDRGVPARIGYPPNPAWPPRQDRGTPRKGYTAGGRPRIFA